MATVSHPALAEIHGIESWRGRPLLVVEFLSGGTLADKLRRGPVSAQRAVSVATLLAAGLAALHEAGYLHGDVKPSNIGFMPSGLPKLLDFGLARETNDADTQGGTLRYLSPEVISGLPAERSRRRLVLVRGAAPRWWRASTRSPAAASTRWRGVFGAGASAAMSGRRRPPSRRRPWLPSRHRC